jgi:peptide chain release factor 1
MDSLPDIAPFQRRLDELDAQMAEPSFYAHSRRAAEVMREHQKLQKLVADFRLHERIERETIEATDLSRDAQADPEMRNLAAAELPELPEGVSAPARARLGPGCSSPQRGKKAPGPVTQ